MEIGILGAGNIGGNLGRRFAEQGHTVRFGVRDPAAAQELVDRCGGRASAGSVAEAARADLVVLAVPWSAVDAVLQAAGDLRGKILVDATNPLQWGPDGPTVAVATSGAEEIAARCGARVVKAFNTLGAEHILQPVVGGVPADVFLCGDDADARRAVAGLAEQIGFGAVDCGPLRNARFAEHLAVGWIWLAMKGGLGRNIAFKVLRG